MEAQKQFRDALESKAYEIFGRVAELSNQLGEPSEEDIKLYIEPVENRADQQHIRDAAVSARKLEAFSWCRRLMEQIYILYDGRMVQCCADWEQRSVMGDLTRESLADICRGERYTDYRRRFMAGDVKGMICACCRKQAMQD